MQRVGVSHDEMHADGRTETRETGDREGLPQTAGWAPEQRARGDDASAREETTLGRYLEKRDVMGQELAPDREEEREAAGEEQGKGGELQEWPAIGHDRFQQTLVLACTCLERIAVSTRVFETGSALE